MSTPDKCPRCGQPRPVKSRTPIMDQYNLHGVGGYARDPGTAVAIRALQRRWAALTPELRELADREADSLKTPDGPGR